MKVVAALAAVLMTQSALLTALLPIKEEMLMAPLPDIIRL